MHWTTFAHCTLGSKHEHLNHILFSFYMALAFIIELLIAQIYPHGSTDTLPFATMGSGSLAAMAVFESKYHEGLTVSVILWFGNS